MRVYIVVLHSKLYNVRMCVDGWVVGPRWSLRSATSSTCTSRIGSRRRAVNGGAPRCRARPGQPPCHIVRQWYVPPPAAAAVRITITPAIIHRTTLIIDLAITPALVASPVVLAADWLLNHSHTTVVVKYNSPVIVPPAYNSRINSHQGLIVLLPPPWQSSSTQWGTSRPQCGTPPVHNNNNSNNQFW